MPLTENGTARLIAGYWRSLRAGLAEGNPALRTYVRRGAGFVWWCRVSGLDVAETRAALLDEQPEQRAA